MFIADGGNLRTWLVGRTTQNTMADEVPQILQQGTCICPTENEEKMDAPKHAQPTRVWARLQVPRPTVTTGNTSELGLWEQQRTSAANETRASDMCTVSLEGST